MKALGLILLLFLVTACGSDQKSEWISLDNDFENMAYWSDGQGLVRDTAGSGRFSTYTDVSHPYTQTLAVTMKDLKRNNIKAILVSCKVMSVHNDPKAKLVVSLEKEGKNLLWQGVEIQQSMKETGAWADLRLRVDVSEALSDDVLLKVYGVNDGQRRVYWDDFTINFE
jgi:hypothetical protein